MNSSNTDYILMKKNESNRYCIPKKQWIYSIKIILHFQIKECSYMFYNCYNLLDEDFSLFDTKNVINISSLFKFCLNLESY